MDPEVVQQPQPAVPQPVMPQPVVLQQPMQPQPAQSSSSWNTVLLFLLGFIILAGVAAGSYYLGMQRTASVMSVSPTPIAAMPTAAPSVVPTASSASAQLLTAGGVLGLKTYTASVPADWTVIHTVKTDSDQVGIAKNGYTINIWEVGGGGGACSYPDNKLTTGIFTDYTTFTQLTDQNGTTYRRGLDGIIATDNTGMKYTVCQLTQGRFFSSLTPYGVIFYTTPKNPDETIVKNMDAIVSTLKAQ